MSSNYTGAITKPTESQMIVCHGYDCRLKTSLAVSTRDSAYFAKVMNDGKDSPNSERAAISKAIQYFEDRAADAIGVRDKGKSTLTDSGHKGQMDCIDESTNSRTLLLYLQGRNLLKYHKVLGNVSRGLMIDGRYPHSTALISDPAGAKWAVDSWYEPMGGAPDILPLGEWQSRGVGGQR